MKEELNVNLAWEIGWNAFAIASGKIILQPNKRCYNLCQPIKYTVYNLQGGEVLYIEYICINRNNINVSL